MDRKTFVQSLALISIGGIAMKLKELKKLVSPLKRTNKMPVLFLGHGSPMNAIEENEFVASFRKLGQTLQKPNAILCISAHWETRGTYVTAMDLPRTIHDFGGFPKALFEVQYPAPGSPELAQETAKVITKTEVGMDHHWGLDHGAWSVIKHLYPDANVPVIQMSLDRGKSPKYHYELAQELSALREKGVLIIGSGNIVHNLRMIAWDKMNVDSYGYDWAIEANEKMKAYLNDGDHQALIDFRSQGKPFQLSIPTPEHYLPLLYTLALKEEGESLKLFNDKLLAGSIAMTSVQIGG
ncbi:MAG: 4,5-DOPA dioxygenase extradiol [Saprospiraceae bacterium]|nr:4,5-DOPA dioxygenase extradiol [Saprospiraceae bacterium]